MAHYRYTNRRGHDVNNDTTTFDADTADPEALRAQIRDLQIQVGQFQRKKDDLHYALSLLAELKSEAQDYDRIVSEWCDMEEESDFLNRYDLIEEKEWRVIVRFGGCIEIDIIVSATTEQAARMLAEDECANGGVQIDVSGACVHEFDIYDDSVEILSASEE